MDKGALACVVLAVVAASCENHAPPTVAANSIAVGPAVQSYADVIDRVAPAVVTIRAARTIRTTRQLPLFDQSFRDLFGLPGESAQREGPAVLQRALGSGVIVTGDGFIVTNYHVVDGAEEIKVDLSQNKTYEAKVTGSDPPSDLAVLKIGGNGLPVLPLGDSDKVRVGDVCLAIGNPLGIGETVTSGIISAKGRSVGGSDGSFQDFLQTDAAINQGNSGGALVNTRGELIGINSQILSLSGGNMGIGFAIPSNMTRHVMDQLRNGGTVHRSVLGVGIQEITPDLAKAFSLKEARGVVVNSVEPSSAADKAGLRRGDVILAIDGKDIGDPNTLRNQIANTKPGTEVTLTVMRDGKEQQIRARLAELSGEKGEAAPARQGSSSGERLGIQVEPLSADLARQLGLRAGVKGVVIVGVEPSSPAASAGLQPRDVIEEVNRTPITSVTGIQGALEHSKGGTALLLINRGGHEVFVPVTLS